MLAKLCTTVLLRKHRIQWITNSGPLHHSIQ